jgi:hypothetical protein
MTALALEIGPPTLAVKNPGDVRSQACYYGNYLAVNNIFPGVTELMLTQGGTFPREWPDADPRGHVTDPLKLWARWPGGVWQSIDIEHEPFNGGSVVTNNVALTGYRLFDFMRDTTFIAAHPECWLGTTAHPSMYFDEQDGLIHCWFTGTVADPHMNAQRQFTAFEATSHNALDWTPVNYHRNHSNLLVQHAALWSGDFVVAQNHPGERGIGRVTALPTTDFLYLFFQYFFGPDPAIAAPNKDGIARRRRGDPNAEFEIWLHGDEWVPATNGELPRAYTSSAPFEGMAFSWNIDHVIFTPPQLRDEPGGDLTLISSPDGLALHHARNKVGTDPTSWHPPVEVKGSRGLVRNYLGPKLVKDGTLWVFGTVDAGVAFGDPSRRGESVADQIFGGSVMATAPTDMNALPVARGRHRAVGRLA